MGINVCYADNSITYDSLALETAMNEINKIGSGSKYNTVEDAAAAFYDAFIYEVKFEEDVSVSSIMNICKDIIKDSKVCVKFINTYNKYLDHANYCLQANKFKAKDFTFKECYDYIINNNTLYVSRDSSGKTKLLCKQWIESAAKCRFYLFGYYYDKKSNANSYDAQYYDCVLNKLQNNDMEFPISKMENSCK